ncbi:hypothetical protein YC2023_046529 [Brassica napus]
MSCSRRLSIQFVEGVHQTSSMTRSISGINLVAMFMMAWILRFMGLRFQELKSSEVPVWSGHPSLKLKGVQTGVVLDACFLDLKEYKSGVEKLRSAKVPWVIQLLSSSIISSRVCAVDKENTDLDTMV